MKRTRYTAVVVGGGPAGAAAALALGRTGTDVLLAAPPHRPLGQAADTRTAALFAGSVELLRNVGAWDRVAPHSAPISAIRIIDDTGALLRAPEVVFTADEVGRETFGWNVPNDVLVAALLAAAAASGSGVTLHETAGIARVETGGDTAVLTSREGDTLEALLVAGADGRNSICRTAAGISTRSWRYAQAAVIATFRHSRPHHGISTEFHRPAGPFTTVPLPGLRSSLVWVERPEEAQRLAGLDDDTFRAALEARLQGMLGPVGKIAPRAMFPLSGLTAEQFGQNRVALVGEAGHVIPPIGAQGLNLGLRDAASLADCVARALGAGDDPGGPAVLAAYSTQRRPDVTGRIATVDVLNRTLITQFPAVGLARGLGLVALKSIGPLRRLAIREGLQPSGELPALLKPDGARLMGELAGVGSRHSAA